MNLKKWENGGGKVSNEGVCGDVGSKVRQFA